MPFTFKFVADSPVWICNGEAMREPGLARQRLYECGKFPLATFFSRCGVLAISLAAKGRNVVSFGSHKELDNRRNMYGSVGPT